MHWKRNWPIPVQSVIVIDEMSIKERVSYDSGSDLLEDLTKGNERGKVLANHAIAFIVRGLRKKMIAGHWIFVSSGPMTGKEMKHHQS